MTQAYPPYYTLKLFSAWFFAHSLNVFLNSLTTFSFLIFTIVSLWLPENKRIAGVRLWLIFLGVSIAAGLYSEVLTPLSLPAITVLGGSAWALGRTGTPTWFRYLAALVLTSLSIALAQHWVPGFNNPVVIDQEIIKSKAVSFSLFLNFDKVLVGIFILGFLHDLPFKASDLRIIIRTSSGLILITAPFLIIPALLFGYIRFDFELNPHLLAWAFINLFFVCFFEEVLFRGFVQRSLTSWFDSGKTGPAGAIGISAILFGLAHYQGGPIYVGLAAIAGISYGLSYYISGRIESAILTHFGINVIHFVFFTYPALAKQFY